MNEGGILMNNSTLPIFMKANQQLSDDLSNTIYQLLAFGL